MSVGYLTECTAWHNCKQGQPCPAVVVLLRTKSEVPQVEHMKHSFHLQNLVGSYLLNEISVVICGPQCPAELLVVVIGWLGFCRVCDVTLSNVFEAHCGPSHATGSYTVSTDELMWN